VTIPKYSTDKHLHQSKNKQSKGVALSLQIDDNIHMNDLTKTCLKGIMYYAIAIACFFSLMNMVGANTSTYTNRDILDALRQVETGGCPNEGIGARGDNGNAIGPYQIHRIYHTDSGLPTYNKCLTSKSYSERVVSSYMMRYASGEWSRALSGKATRADCLKIARIHNGGPRGHRKTATKKYANKVDKLL